MTPLRWMWGVPPLALLWLSANIVVNPMIEASLAARASRVIARVVGEGAAAARPVLQTSGRDIAVTGEAPRREQAARILGELRGLPGVGRVSGSLSQPVMRQSYTWKLVRSGNSVSLEGQVAEDALAQANRAAVEKALPAAAIRDRQEVAAGVPATTATFAPRLIALLQSLESGSLSVTDGRVCIEGRAATPEAYRDLIDALAALPGGAETSAECALEPAAVAPFRWSLSRSEAGAVEITGYLPSRSARELIQAAVLRDIRSSSAATDRALVAAGAPTDFERLAERAVADLAKLSAGEASLVDGRYSLRGRGPADAATCARIRREIERQPGAPAELSVECPAAASIRTEPDSPPPPPPAVPPTAPPPPVPTAFMLDMQVDRTGLTLSGRVPNEAAKAGLVAAYESVRARRSGVTDEAARADGAPPGFAEAARVAASDLARLDAGRAVLAARTIELQGLTCRELIRDEIEASMRLALPAGFEGRSAVALRQTGCTIEPPDVCQTELDDLTRRSPVLLIQGAAGPLDGATERTLAEAAGILTRCPQARVIVEGHANADGEGRGFNNLELTRRRAARIRDELVERGIDASRLEARGLGIERPLVASGAPDARTRNRRIQFTVVR